nr:hypothetical protein [Candidatus Njordarchaeota archaeon]
MYVLPFGGVCPPLGKPYGGTPNTLLDETGYPSGKVNLACKYVAVSQRPQQQRQ